MQLDAEVGEVLAGGRPWWVGVGDSLEVMRSWPDACIHCAITSPPFWNLRDYGTAEWSGGDPACDHKGPGRHQNLDRLGERYAGGGKKHSARESEKVPFLATCGKCGAKRTDAQLGLEPLHDCGGWAAGERCGRCYVDRMTEVFREVRRVLHPSGVCVVNIGDSYWGGGGGNYGEGKSVRSQGGQQLTNIKNRGDIAGVAAKNLLGVPWRLALSMQADGWILRNDATWQKLSPMPSSATDRLTVAHECLFLFSKSKSYHWDGYAVRRPSASTTLGRDRYTRVTGGKDGQYAVAHDHETPSDPAGRQWRTSDVWADSLDVMIEDTEDYLRHLKKIRDGQGMLVDPGGEALALRVGPEPYHGAHYAVYPVALVTPWLRAACSEKGVCSRCGAPWRRVVEKGKGDEEAARRPKHLQSPKSTLSLSGNGSKEWAERGSRIRAAGWKPGCKCGPDAGILPPVVLDPFVGSGTSIVAAKLLGLRGLGIDLSADHVRQAQERIATALRTDELKSVRKADDDTPSLFARPAAAPADGPREEDVIP